MSLFYKYVISMKVSMATCESQSAQPTTIQMKVKVIKGSCLISPNGATNIFSFTFPLKYLDT